VREIFKRFSQGEAVSAIVRDLDERGIRTKNGSQFSRPSVTRIVLDGAAYIGKRRFNGGPLLDGDWNPIVDEDTYWRAVAVLSDPARKPANGGIRPGSARWLLSYLATCGVCGGLISMRHAPRAGSRQVAYYRCVRKGCVQAPVSWADGLAGVGVAMFCAGSPLYEVLTRGEDAQAQAARDEAQSERDRLAEFEEQAATGAISAASFARIASKIEAHIAELEARAVELSAPPALRELQSSAATREERFTEIHARWEAMELASKRSVIRAIFAPELHPAGSNAADPRRFRMPLAPGLRIE
jgi:hypothetical protein